MKFRMPKLATACFLLLATVLSSDAQIQEIDPLEGRSCTQLHGVVSQAQVSAFGVSIELRNHFDLTQTHSSPIINGTFEVTCIPVGDYSLQVLDISGKVIHSQQVAVRGIFESVHVMLSGSQSQRPASQWVSVRQLQRKTDRKAQSELRKAHAAAERGRLDEAIERSHKALARDPGYPQAWLELGYVYSLMSRYEEAAAQFTKALELDPEFMLAHRNIGIAMLKLKRYEAAEQAARQALKLARPLPEMEFALGLSLGEQTRNLDEAIEHLDRAAASHPRARLAAVRFLAEAGRRSDAASRLEQYLRVSGDSPERKELESLLSRLR